ncbi:MAG: type II secretion system protein [Deltaproteobacteria bacterium]|nr:type II secretion system protein [Deltaproteobacteria bacterium]
MGRRFAGGSCGFTLIELVFVIALLGILAVSAQSVLISINQNAQTSAELGAVGSVKTGVEQYRMESLLSGRVPVLPPFLDQASVGSASSDNPLFGMILGQGITSQWQKTGMNSYQGPTGNAYRYDPASGQFDSLTADPFALYGKIIGQTSGLLVFDSGTLLSTFSSLLFNPNFETGEVKAALASGIKINTDGSRGAVVTLLDGSTITVEDVFNSWNILDQKNTLSPDGMNYTGKYAAIGYGQAFEGNYESDYLKKESSYDNKSGSYSYDYEYNSKGDYSGVGLSIDNGFVYEVSYQSKKPSQFRANQSTTKNGDYTGSYEASYDQSYTSNYGKSDKKNPYAQTITTGNSGDYSYTYQYDASSQVFASSGSGSYAYDYQYEQLNGSKNYADQYDYATNYNYNRKTGETFSQSTYKSKTNGTDRTYTFTYDPKSRKEIYTETDNVTGKTTQNSHQR